MTIDAFEVRRDSAAMSAMTDIQRHTCPYCELVFLYHNEVKDHILHDHPEHRHVVETIEPHEMPHS